jgi:hypothetical protein
VTTVQPSAPAPAGAAASALAVDFPETDEEVAALVDALNSTGFVCLPNAVRPDWLGEARDHVRRLLEREGEGYYGIVRPADEAGSAADRLVHDPRMQSLLRRATAKVCPQGLVEFEDVYNVMRIISGPNGRADSLNFHHDASVITALVPLFIPDPAHGESGAFVIFPNRRGFRRSVLVNLAEKLLLQNRIASGLAARRAARAREAHVRYLVPGNIYLFWGYRSYHANRACAPHALRASLMIFYGNPHGNSAVLHWIRDGRRAFEKLRRALR